MEDRALENQVAIRLECADLTVAPGSSVTVPLSAQNLSASDGAFELAVRGIPSVWVSVPALAAEGIAQVAGGAAEMGAAEALHVTEEMTEEVAE